MATIYHVTISRCYYCLDEDEIVEWLGVYREAFGNLPENFHREEEFPSAKPISNGTYSMKMCIDKPILQFLPMYWKKVRIDHRDQQIMCTNCYGRHPRKVFKWKRFLGLTMW